MRLVDWVHRNIPLIALMTLAAAIRVFGISWGLPEVFEEATPMRQAWQMWGWDGGGLDLNPHFFNYPSLVIYLQLIGQAVLLEAMKALGTIESNLDFRALYAVDKTAFVLVGRYITAAFGVAAVGAVFALARRIAPKWTAVVAALLLACNVLHIAKSQVVEVDVPLTFLVVLALVVCVDLLRRPTRGRYVVAGVVVGLAASAKYTGAVLILSVLAAHLVARRETRAVPVRWSFAVVSIVAAAVAFFATSPYVVLDMATFIRHISVEQYHMQTGHFGLVESASWADYLRWSVGGALGWPTLILGLSGLVLFTFIRRHGWAIVLTAFIIPYAVVVGSWSMRAERYLLPLVPALIVFAVALLPELGRLRFVSRAGAHARVGFAAIASLVMLAPLAAALPGHLERAEPDSRTLARQWIEANVPAGSFIVTEAYGPELYGPYAIWDMDDKIRRRLFRTMSDRPYYAVQTLPMYQVDSERSGAFYDHDVLSMADYIVTTSSVRGRYEREPARFDRQAAFYKTLDGAFDKAQEIAPAGAGPRLRIYRNRSHAAPFAERSGVAAPPPLAEGLPVAPGAQEHFYFYLGINFEAFNHFDGAYTCYETAFRYSIPEPRLIADVSIGMARCLDRAGQHERAVELLARIESAATDPRDRARISRYREDLARSGR